MGDTTTNPDELPGEFNDTLADDADQFGGSGESDVVPTYHVKVTSADLERFADTKEPLVVEDIALVWRGRGDTPDADFTAAVSQCTLECLSEGDIVNYGIRRVDGENQTVHISKGGVSDLFDDERSPMERLKQDMPHLRPPGGW